MVNVTRPNEVSLFGYFYPVEGPIKEGDAAEWAPKQVTGDWTKDSQKFTSSVIWSDHRAGLGIKDMVEGKDDNRFYFSTCETGYKGHLALPPLVTDCGKPTASSSDCVILIEYNNSLYAVWGTDVRRWVHASSSWSASLRTLSATPTAAIVYKSKLYFACGTDFERYDGTNWTDGATLSGTAIASRYFCEWDSKLFSVANDGTMKFTTGEGSAWVPSATSTLETGSFTSLYLDMGSTGTLMPHLGTKVGTFELDFDSSTWQPTGLKFPPHDYACLGATQWRDAGYVPVGMAVYQYRAGVPSQVTPIGPDRDYGVPNDYRGNIIQLVGEHNGLYALVDATTAASQDLYTATYSADTVFYDDVGYSMLLKWNGAGWQVVYVSGSQALAAKTMTVATADSTYRLWFAMNNTVYYLPLNVNLQNPIELSDATYAASCVHTLPWFDANAIGDKTGFNVSVYIDGATSTEYAKVYYGTDYDDNTWTLLTNTSFTDGQIDSDGEASFTFASGAGLAFKAIRFKVELYRGSTTTLTPDVRWLRLDYIKLLSQQYGFDLVLDCSRDYRHKRASTLVAAIKTAYETQTLGVFVYRTPQETSESYRVKVMSFAGATQAGRLKEGRYRVSLVAL